MIEKKKFFTVLALVILGAIIYIAEALIGIGLVSR